MFEIGRICMKTAGREAGRFCVVIAKEKEKDFVLITGPKAVTRVKRRKCNFRHLEPTPLKIEIKENATDEEIAAAYEKFDVLNKLNVRTITAGEAKPKKAEETEEKHGEEKKEEKARKHEEKKEEHKAEHAHEHKEAKEHKEEKKEHEHKEAKPKKTRAKKAKKEE